MDNSQRARAYAAIGDEKRLELIDLLLEGDRSVQELGNALSIPGNLLAHHLKVLDEAGVIERRESEGDRRRRYVMLRLQTLEGLNLVPAGLTSPVFVCTRNSARSQYAAAYWAKRTGQEVTSAGADPASTVHPLAIRVAGERGLDLAKARPRGYDSLTSSPSLVISVCDRAREAGLPDARRQIHWSVRDPVLDGRVGAFRSAFDDIEQRIDAITP
jgi:protein-tyrosine-phosphatase/DNA-binding HxlR family transcriptional regulator